MSTTNNAASIIALLKSFSEESSPCEVAMRGKYRNATVENFVKLRAMMSGDDELSKKVIHQWIKENPGKYAAEKLSEV